VKRPPRLVERTLLATFLTVAIILLVTFIQLSIETRTRAEEVPMEARIVHVADAFDAMTSARAYRPARPASVALAELRRHEGTQFDRAVVDALHAAMPSAAALSDLQLQELLEQGA